MTRLEPAVKWAVDRVVAAVALVVFSPVFLVIWAWVRRDAGKPVFLSQLRAGRDGVPFKLLKIRTMVPNAVDVGRELALTDDPFGVVPDDPRVTRSGRVLRRTLRDRISTSRS